MLGTHSELHLNLKTFFHVDRIKILIWFSMNLFQLHFMFLPEVFIDFVTLKNVLLRAGF